MMLPLNALCAINLKSFSLHLIAHVHKNQIEQCIMYAFRMFLSFLAVNTLDHMNVCVYWLSSKPTKKKN